MGQRRILSLWFPRLGAERLLRRLGEIDGRPFAVAADHGGAQVLTSLSDTAEAAGLRPGQGLRDARAMCPDLVTRWQNPVAEAAFLSALARWAGRYSPWVAEEAPNALLMDVTGCAHLFGGEEALLRRIEADCADLCLTMCCGLADTVGGAWALARFAGRAGDTAAGRSGDAIDMEAPATRSRAARRGRQERVFGPSVPLSARIAPPGQVAGVIGSLPAAALRIEAELAAELSRLGLRAISDLCAQPRAALARRFGRHLVLRLEQALGMVPEPVSPARPETRFAARIGLPDPIGLEEDVLAAIDRVLPVLCARLKDRGRGARVVRLECHRADHTMGAVEVSFSRPAHEPGQIRPLLALKLPEIDAGFGIDMVRLVAVRTEPMAERQHRGHAEAEEDARARLTGAPIDELIDRIGARVGMEHITRLAPAESHIPEKAAMRLSAAWSGPAERWPASPVLRPPLLWPPEAVDAPPGPAVPARFRWRRREMVTLAAEGPERIAPEWWFDDPAWRTGVRDYWRVTCESGEMLWLYFAHGAALSPGWFCHGSFT